jgi:hypothetical protein
MAGRRAISTEVAQMSGLRIFLSALAAVVLLGPGVDAFAGSNQPTQACGTFSSTANGLSNGAARCTIEFAFEATMASCNAEPCTCSKVAYVQVIRARDVDRDQYIQPFEEQQERMIVGESAPQLNGWAIDRRANNEWGYFARLNGDEVEFDEGSLKPGNNDASPKVKAWMSDRPARWRKHVEFEAVSVPVCLDESSACINRLLGYQHWSFHVQDNGKGSNPVRRIATEWERDAVGLALAKWNEQASSPVEAFPDLQPLN